MCGHCHPESGMQARSREWSLCLCKAPWLRGGQSVTLSSAAPASAWATRPWGKDCCKQMARHSPHILESPWSSRSSTLKATGGLQSGREQHCCFPGMTNMSDLLNKFSAQIQLFFNFKDVQMVCLIRISSEAVNFSRARAECSRHYTSVPFTAEKQLFSFSTSQTIHHLKWVLP